MRRSWSWIFLVSLLVAGGLSLLASEHPDGLERVAADHGFEGAAAEPGMEVMPDYEAPWLGAGPASRVLPGVVGTAVVALLAWALGRAIAAHRHRGEAPGDRSGS